MMMGMKPGILNWLMVGVALLGAVTVLMMLSGCVSGLVYPGARPGFLTDDAVYNREHAAQYVRLAAEDGTPLCGWLFNRGSGRPLVVMYSGNGMSAGDWMSFAEADEARSYLMVNYRGYGGSAGEPTEEHLVQDACSVLRQVREQVKPSSVALVGFSLGTGVAVQTAAQEDVQALVLICPFDSMENVACDMVPLLPRLLLRDTYESAAYAPKVSCPVTVFSATQDEIVGAQRTQALMQAFPQPVTHHAVTAGHNTILASPGFGEALRQVLPR